MKILVETTSNIFLQDPTSGCEVNEFRPSVVELTPFIERYVARKDIRVLANELPDDASDAEFAEFWAESPETAVEAFVSSEAGDTPDSEEVTPPKSAESKKAPAKKAPAKKAAAKKAED